MPDGAAKRRRRPPLHQPAWRLPLLLLLSLACLCAHVSAGQHSRTSQAPPAEPASAAGHASSSHSGHTPTTPVAPSTTTKPPVVHASTCEQLPPDVCLQLNRWPCSVRAVAGSRGRAIDTAPANSDDSDADEQAEAAATGTSTGSGSNDKVEARCGPCFDGYHHSGAGGDGHGNGPCTPCAPMCWYCNGPAPNQCLSCAPGYSFESFDFLALVTGGDGGVKSLVDGARLWHWFGFGSHLATTQHSSNPSPASDTATRRTLCTPNCNNSVNYMALALLTLAQLWCVWTLVIPVTRHFATVIRTHSTLSQYLSDTADPVAPAPPAGSSSAGASSSSSSSAGVYGRKRASSYGLVAVQPHLLAALETRLPASTRTGVQVCALFVGFALSVLLFDEREWATDKSDLLLTLQIATAMALPVAGLLQTQGTSNTSAGSGARSQLSKAQADLAAEHDDDQSNNRGGCSSCCEWSVPAFWSDVLHSVLVSGFLLVHVLAAVGHGHHFHAARAHYRFLRETQDNTFGVAYYATALCVFFVFVIFACAQCVAHCCERDDHARTAVVYRLSFVSELVVILLTPWLTVVASVVRNRAHGSTQCVGYQLLVSWASLSLVAFAALVAYAYARCVPRPGTSPCVRACCVCCFARDRAARPGPTADDIVARARAERARRDAADARAAARAAYQPSLHVVGVGIRSPSAPVDEADEAGAAVAAAARPRDPNSTVGTGVATAVILPDDDDTDLTAVAAGGGAARADLSSLPIALPVALPVAQPARSNDSASDRTPLLGFNN